MRLNKNIIFTGLLFFAVLASYGNIFQNDFAWDDFFFIVDNIRIRDFGNVPDFFMEPSTGDLYRPLRQVFYALNYRLWGLNTWGYHLNSFLLHFFVTTLFYFITLKLTGKKAFSFVAALFFAAHPVHVERITNMTAAFDVFGILFLLLAFFLYVVYTRNKGMIFYYLSIAFYLLGLFSSEEAITLIFLLFLHDISFNHKLKFTNFKFLLKRYAPYLIITVFYLIVRFSILGKIGRAESYFEQSFIGTLLTTVKVFAQYLLILLFPLNIPIERSVSLETTVFSIGFLAPLILLIIALLIFVKSYSRSRIIFFSIGWFFITLMPFSNLVPQFTIMADRYLYLPSFGFSLFMTFLIFGFHKTNWVKKNTARKYAKAITILITIFVVSFYIFATIKTNLEWKDNLTLLSANLEKNPYGTRIHYAAALHYRNHGDYDAAERYALRAIELASGNYNAYENLGTIYAYRNDYDAAIRHYEKAIDLSPRFYLAHDNLGLVYSYIGDFNKSIFYLEKAIGINPKLSKAHNDLGTVYGQIGEFDKAIGLIGKAIEINPGEGSYYQNLAAIYGFLGDNKKADELLEKASKLQTFGERVKRI